MEFRIADADDLASIVALTAVSRDRLAQWSPLWWSKPEGADAIHQRWLEHVVTTSPGTHRVATVDDEVVGCFAANRQPTQWFVDDVAVREDDQWPAFAVGLVHNLDERPALTCLSSKDTVRGNALLTAGCDHVSSYWIRPPTGSVQPSAAVDPSMVTSWRPPHTFGGLPFDHTAVGALAFTSDDGAVVGSPSVKAPPIYGSGGTVTVIDLVTGPRPERLLVTALGLAAARHDEVLCVVCGTADEELAQGLERTGFTRTVDVHRFPSP